MKLTCAAVLWCSIGWAQWTAQSSGTTASLRGISAVNETTAWASGANGTVLRTVDGGRTWRSRPIPGGEKLDFRGIRAFDGRVVIVMSAGPGELSRIYGTSDAGENWTLLFQNRDEKGFLDAIAFWDRRRGLVLGDAVEGRMVLLRTGDGGAHWQRVEDMPPARDGEGAFAASNTALVVRPEGRAWFATGGAGRGRVFRSEDWGKTWTAASTPVRQDAAGSGIFSLAFLDDLHGFAVGGNYTAPAEDNANIAATEDGGRTWIAPDGSHPRGYRSAVIFVPHSRIVIATGAGGTDISRDGGRSWSAFGSRGFHALGASGGKVVWAVGDKGSIARWNP